LIIVPSPAAEVVACWARRPPRLDRAAGRRRTCGNPAAPRCRWPAGRGHGPSQARRGAPRRCPGGHLRPTPRTVPVSAI